VCTGRLRNYLAVSKTVIHHDHYPIEVNVTESLARCDSCGVTGVLVVRDAPTEARRSQSAVLPPTTSGSRSSTLHS